MWLPSYEPRGAEVAGTASPHEDPRRTYPTPYRNVRPEVQPVGDAACAECHPQQAQTYRRHPMGRSLAPVAHNPAPEHYDAAAHNAFQAAGFEYRVERQDPRVIHREVRRDPEGEVIAETEADVQFVLGSGEHGCSYLINRDGYLFQSPISWYSQKAIWDLSPGYTSRHHHFERAVEAECLYCHCNHADAVEGTLNRYREPIFRGYAIGCERCHGPGQLHVQARAAGAPVGQASSLPDARQTGSLPHDADDTIVNPRHLPPALREAVCEQCHLQGESRVVRAGRDRFEYRPGLPLELFWEVFVRAAAVTNNPRAVSHVEQMHASRCFQASAGRMGCISCHDPHRLPEPAERVAYYRDRCLACHRQDGCTLPLAERQRTNPADNCTACHMPARHSSNIAHASITDHRVIRRPDGDTPRERTREDEEQTSEAPLVPFHRQAMGSKEGADPAQGRDLGVALIDVVRHSTTPVAVSRLLGQQSLALLEPAARADPGDVPARHALGYAYWLMGRREEAASAFEAVLAQVPGREETLVAAAALAAETGRAEAALLYWQQAVAVNRWQSRYHAELAKLHAAREEWQLAARACQAALRLNPAITTTRKLLASCYLRLGDAERARAEFAKVIAPDPGSASGKIAGPLR
jgi:tetratricopeptide (TPR) repeat protein